MASVAAASPVDPALLSTALLRRLRGGSWRRWVVAALAFNIALGMGLSVVALRHQADSRGRADVLLAELDAATSAQEAQLWRALAAGRDTDDASLDTSAARADDVAVAVTRSDAGLSGGSAVDAALTAYRRAVSRARTALSAGVPTARATLAEELTPAATRLHAAIADTARRHQAADTDFGRVADIETVVMMVFAAVMAGLLFRRFEAARRSGELGVAAARARLQHNAFHDALTGLANRALFTDRLQHALARTDRLAAPVAVLFVDLDDFKAVNDGAGHTAGDDLLTAVAERLRLVLRPGDTIARLGGDEFAVLIEDAAEPGRAHTAAERLLTALAEPFDVAGPEGRVGVTASVGIALGAAGQHDADELLRHADVAMYAAKAAGKGRSAVFEPEMDSAIIGQLRLKAELARAVEQGEFTVYYQPTVELATGRLSGVEALVRWQHPERGLVPPLDFIPTAEQTGLIVPIGRFVLTEACRQMRAWHDSHPAVPPMTVSVNLSARELDEPGLVASVRGALQETGLDPAHLVLEITESLLLVDLPGTVAKLSALRELGVRLAVDDFGTGYSSLSYLENLPVDILKIDKSFVDRIGEAPTAPQAADGAPQQPVMVSAISRLGHALHLDLVAEGIEQPEQVTALRGLACQFGQGYYFARPLTADALEGLLVRQADEPGWAFEAALNTA